MDEVINVDSSDAEDDSDDVSLFSDEDFARLLCEEAQDPIEAEAEAEADAIIYPIASFLCPISCALFKDPVVCQDGVTYERQYIDQQDESHHSRGDQRYNPISQHCTKERNG